MNPNPKVKFYVPWRTALTAAGITQNEARFYRWVVQFWPILPGLLAPAGLYFPLMVLLFAGRWSMPWLGNFGLVASLGIGLLWSGWHLVAWLVASFAVWGLSASALLTLLLRRAEARYEDVSGRRGEGHS